MEYIQFSIGMLPLRFHILLGSEIPDCTHSLYETSKTNLVYIVFRYIEWKALPAVRRSFAPNKTNALHASCPPIQEKLSAWGHY